jgi:hypothetical protein
MTVCNDFEMMSVGALLPAPYNPNFLSAKQFEQLVDEVKRTGRCQKHIVARSNGDGTYITIDGAHNLQAAIEAGLLEVPVEVIEADDYEARRQTYKRNLSGTWRKVRLGRMWRDMMTCGPGRSGRDLAADLGVTEGTVRNGLLYAQADELRALHDDTRTEDEIASMSVRQLREYIAKLEVAVEGDGATTVTSPEPVEDEPADLRALKLAWGKACATSRASFMAWPPFVEVMGSSGDADIRKLRNSYAVPPSPIADSVAPLDAVASAPAGLSKVTRRHKRVRLPYGITAKQLTTLCKAAGTSSTAVAEQLGYTGPILSRHVNGNSTAPPDDAVRLAIRQLRKQARALKPRSAKRKVRRSAKAIAAAGPARRRAAA